MELLCANLDPRPIRCLRPEQRGVDIESHFDADANPSPGWHRLASFDLCGFYKFWITVNRLL